MQYIFLAGAAPLLNLWGHLVVLLENCIVLSSGVEIIFTVGSVTCKQLLH